MGQSQSWPPLHRLAERAPVSAFESSRALRAWAETASGSLACLRWAQQILEGVLLLKVSDPRMLRWADAPANVALTELAREDLSSVAQELTKLNRHMARLALADPVDVTPILGPVPREDSGA